MQYLTFNVGYWQYLNFELMAKFYESNGYVQSRCEDIITMDELIITQISANQGISLCNCF